MSVYIKGIEMPKNCHSCPMCLMRFCQAADSELSERETRPNAKRPEDCSLLPVPPHGRLIEENDVLAIVSEYCPDDDGSVGKVADLREMLDEIEALPTIIPAEEGRHEEIYNSDHQRA